MNCSKCGAKIDYDTKFCASCGTATELSNTATTGKIIIARKSSFFGCAIPFHIYVDGTKLNDLTNGKVVECPIGYGKHSVTFTSTGKNVVEEVEISETQKNVKLSVKVKIGLIAGEPKIFNKEYFN